MKFLMAKYLCTIIVKTEKDQTKQLVYGKGEFLNGHQWCTLGTKVIRRA